MMVDIKHVLLPGKIIINVCYRPPIFCEMQTPKMFFDGLFDRNARFINRTKFGF